MESNRILAWIATIIAIPAVGWLFITTASSQSRDASQDTAIRMMNDHLMESREEDRAFRESMKQEISKMADGFNAMGRSFSRMEGVFDTLDFKVGNNE